MKRERSVLVAMRTIEQLAPQFTPQAFVEACANMAGVALGRMPARRQRVLMTLCLGNLVAAYMQSEAHERATADKKRAARRRPKSAGGLND